jgi:large subunit ribosomal protein L29
MKAKEIRDMSADQMSEEIMKLRREQFNLRMQSATGQGAKPHQFGRARKDIARLKTIQRERELGEKAEAK